MASADVAEEVELCAMDNTVLLRFEKEEYIVMHTRALARRHEGHSNWITASGHLITVMVGAGVLSLPAAMSWLGWVGGLVSLLLFYAISLWCSLMLAAVYKVDGHRHPTYSQAVLSILGRLDSRVLVVVQQIMLCLAAIGYAIAAADSMTFMAAQSCAQGQECVGKHWQMALIFGGVQMVLSLLPNLESVWLVSALGALMSIGYSLLTVGLGASQAHHGLGSLWGRSAPPGVRVFSILNALGQMAFAYGCAVVQLEVQDTLKEPPDAQVSMRKAVTASISTAFGLYLLVSVLCYLALGDTAHSMVLTSFTTAAPWATALGNALVLVHMMSAFQVFCQPMFAAMEAGLARQWPQLDKWTEHGTKRLQLVRLCYRGLYVTFLTVVALLFPFFGAFIGLIGSVAFWPLAVYFPIKMYAKVHPPQPLQRAIMLLVNVLTAALSLGAAAGSIADLVQSAKQFNLGGF